MAKNYQRPQYTQTKEPVAGSTEEVIQEEITVSEEVAQETAVEETVAEVTEVQEPEVVEEAVSEATPVTTQEGFAPVYKVELELSQYAEAMDKQKVINPEEGGRWQYSLFTNIRAVLNANTQEDFNKEWNTILNFFNKNKDGVFNERFIFRFPEYWPGSAIEFVTFRRLVFVILETANVQTRKKKISDINLELVTENLTEAQKTRLVNFYG